MPSATNSNSASATNATTRRVRTWADLVTIFGSLIALANAMWGPLIFSSMQARYPQGDPGVTYNWLAFGVGGLLGITAMIVAQRWTKPARALLALAGLLLVAVPLMYAHRGSPPAITSMVIGLALLLAAPFLGQLPHAHTSMDTPERTV